MTIRIRAARCLTLLLLIACGGGREKKVNENKLLFETSMADATVDAAAIKWLRLIEESETTSLVYAVTRRSADPVLRYVTIVMSRVAPSRADAPLVEVSQLLPTPPAWDLARLPFGGYELVHEVAGGALTTLTLRGTLSSAEGNADAVSGQHPFESFGMPRFVRDSESPAPVLALNNGNIVVFTRPAAGQPFPKYRRIAAGESAVALRTDDGYLMFYKVRSSGPVRGVDIAPGVLHVLPLASDFAPRGEPKRPLGERTVYELDAATSVGRTCAVVTTESGALLLCGTGGHEMTLLHEFQRDRPLSAPAIARDGAGVAMTFIENAGTQGAHFLHVSLRL